MDASQTKKANVLLVDDDEDYLLSTRVQLENAGYAVTTAPGVREAKALLEAGRPDAAIIDLMMEETDGGFALCHFIKRRHGDVPVIMVSAVTSETGLDFDPTSADERSWVKADAFLAKPVRFEQMEGALRRLIKE